MSLKKIAAMTGVSPSTVSRVLNRTSPTCASEETQDRIWAAAREIGYVPNEAARRLKTNSYTGTEAWRVTIIMARFTSVNVDPFFAELFRSLEAELLKYKVVIERVVYAGEPVPKELQDSDGVLILGRCPELLLEDIAARNENIVGIWRNSMEFAVDEVICDGEKAADMAMEYLLSLGHSKIAYIGDCSYESRYIGYCNALIKNHIAMDYNLIKQTDQTQEEAETAFSELLEGKLSGRRDFSAVLCANDATAIRVLEILGKQRKQLKNSISVISIDDIEAAQNTKPYLTTIRIPIEEMSHMAVRLLVDRIEGEHRESVRIEFPCKLIERGSCYRE